MDNVTNNDDMLSALKDRPQEEGVKRHSTSQRPRCSGHIIQLAVGDFLLRPHPDLSDSDGLTRENAAQWRQLGSLGKLHDTIVWAQ